MAVPLPACVAWIRGHVNLTAAFSMFAFAPPPIEQLQRVLHIVSNAVFVEGSHWYVLPLSWWKAWLHSVGQATDELIWAALPAAVSTAVQAAQRALGAPVTREPHAALAAELGMTMLSSMVCAMRITVRDCRHHPPVGRVRCKHAARLGSGELPPDVWRSSLLRALMFWFFLCAVRC